ncbi:hypothetical protein FRC01_009976, partial [Tulasnella sp. 417]
MYNEQHQLPLFQYNTAYFNPYEVKHRKRTSRAQLTVLEATFQENNKPSSAVKKALAAQLDMPIRNVQVWFQNRRAKDKNIAAKAKAKEAAAAAAADQADRDGADDDFDDDEDSNPEASTPPAPSSSSSGTSTLSPPTNLGLRRGSAPNLGGNTPPDFASSTSTFKIRPSPPQAAARSASDSARVINNPIPVPPTPNDANIPATVNLGRRKSLPAFHPSFRPSGVPQIPSLPTVADVNRLSQSPEVDAKRIAPGSAGPGSGTTGEEMGHGGVYRSASSSRLSAAAAAPYPATSSRSPMAYRSGSTPGTGVFRIPANPNPSGQSWQGPSTVNISEDASFAGGLRQQQTSSTPTDNNPNQPYSFPPRPYADIPRSGPLPSKDFVFGDSGGAASALGAFRDSPPATTNEDEEERLHGLTQSHRFGSFASEFSIESDATGTTATTATSTEFSPLNIGAARGPSSAFRTRYPPGFGRGPGLGHANTDSGLGASISYGMSSGSVAGLPGLSAGPVSYPTKFDPESRRASCPAHFIQDMASLAVDQFHQTEHPQDI